MAEYIGPNGPVRLPPGSYEHFDLRTRLEAALAGPDAGRKDRVDAALEVAGNRLPAGWLGIAGLGALGVKGLGTLGVRI